MKLPQLALTGLASVCLAAIGSGPMAAQQLYARPDFAYPQNVRQEATSRLSEAERSGDSRAMLRALLNLSLAESAISADNLPDVIERINELRAGEKDQAVASLLDILLAGIYGEIYADDASAYNERPAMLDASGKGDYRQWSGNQMTSEIIGLVDRALTAAPALKSVPVTDYDGVLELDKAEVAVYNPTLLDFVAHRASEILSGIQWGNTQARTRRTSLISFMVEQDAGNAAESVRWQLAAIDDPSQATDRLMQLYDKYAGQTPAVAEVLTTVSDTSDRKQTATWLHDSAEDFIARWPGYYRLACVKNVLARVSARRVNINVPGMVYPGTDLTVTANSTNVERFTVSLWRVPEAVPLTDNYVSKTAYRRQLVEVASAEGGMSGHSVPFSFKQTLTLPVNEPGRYVVKVTFDGSDGSESGNSMRIITCSRLATFTSMLKSRDAYVVDAATGAPVSGAGLSLLNNERGSTVKVTKLGSTDKNGFHALDSGLSGMLMASKGSDKSALQSIWRMSEPRLDTPVRFIEGYSSLPLYHPGDTLEWCAVVYESQGYSHRLLEGHSLTATLRDANYQDIDTLRLRTDDWGRVSASMSLPKDRLTGRYSVMLALTDGSGKTEAVSSISFEVSDYKLPTYQVITNPAQPVGGGAYSVTGRLMTYTGMPLRDCKVSLNLQSAMPVFRWRSSSSQSFHTAETTTDSDGRFEFTIPASVLQGAPYPDGIFMAGVTAVSQSGESQGATVSFSRRPVCLISVSMGSSVDISNPVKLHIMATDIDDKPLDTPISYKIAANDSVVKEGTVRLTDATADWSGITPGRYDISFAAAGMPDSEPFKLTGIYLYKTADAPSPSELPIWSPTERVATDAAGRGSIVYGTPEGEAHVLVSLWNPEDASLIEQKWQKVKGGMNTLHLGLPPGLDRAHVTLTSTRRFRTESIEAEMKRPDEGKRLVVTASSMRDKTSPLAEERWTFTLRHADGTPVEGAMIMDMYAKAIDRLATSSWSMAPGYGNLATLFMGTPYLSNVSTSASATTKWLECPEEGLPQWQLWGLSLTGAARMMTYATSGMKMSAVRIRGTHDLNAVREHKEAIMVVDEVKTEATADMAAAEEAAPELAGAAGTDGGSADTADTRAAIDYRPSEIPLAFFKPLLATDSEGDLTMTFTVPNAVTTWQFNALAFTRDMLTASLSSEIVSTKPLMVQPNLPRFVRAGDRVEILTTVFNKSDSPLETTVTASATDESTSRTIAAQSRTVTIGSGESQVVDLPVDVTLAAGSVMRCRVSAQAGNFTDGEQALVPVLKSEASIIESRPFYLHPDSASVSVSLPEVPSEGAMTLQYCENPLWMAVLALPTLSNPDATTAPEAADELLMSVAAKSIVEQYPVVAEAIRRWSGSNRSDSTLVSMLERNPELKQLMLASTPWMRQAASDTERMSRLAMLLDGDNVARAIASAIEKLRSLQAADGGWRWMAESREASLWATTAALRSIGALNELGWMPKDREVTDMVKKAVSYLDAETAARYRRWPDASYIDYALLRDMFAYTQSSEAHQASNAALREARNGWKGMGTVLKARVAVLLENHGYGDISRDILASLTQYALTSPQRGMWWDNVGLAGQIEILNAYTLLKPKGAEVDRIRQWIIFEKEAQDWGDTPEATLIVAGLLTSSPSWIVPAQDVTVSLGDEKLAVPRADYASGFFTMPLSTSAASRSTLTIDHQKGMPSWGAVVSQYERKATAVKAHPIDGLSIDKALLIEKPGADGQKWAESDNMGVGTAVKVRLTVICDRDMDYVSIVDERGACFEPKDQLPGYIYSQNLSFYRESRDSDTRIFIEHLPKGTYVLTYDVSANNAGRYSGGVATIQSQMTPSLTAHSGGALIEVTSRTE